MSPKALTCGAAELGSLVRLAQARNGLTLMCGLRRSNTSSLKPPSMCSTPRKVEVTSCSFPCDAAFVHAWCLRRCVRAVSAIVVRCQGFECSIRGCLQRGSHLGRLTEDVMLEEEEAFKQTSRRLNEASPFAPHNKGDEIESGRDGARCREGFGPEGRGPKERLEWRVG